MLLEAEDDIQSRCTSGILLAVYFVIVLVLSFFQLGYINADFVAYVTVTHRMLDGSGPFVTGYWSPLFSWLMAPFVWAGVGDLYAGRIVLIAGGALYVFAALRFMRNLLSHDLRLARTLCPAYGICVILQAAIWATFLLDADILADGLLFLYFSLVVDPALMESRRRATGAGVVAGLAYLAKAYMLPFAVVHLAATLALHRLAAAGHARSGLRSLLPFFRTGCLVIASMVLVAGPWIGVLSVHYGKLVFSTAGTFNHANMGPLEFAKDPLWNPGLIPDYMADPHLDSDWSPLGGRAEFLHQIKITIRNIINGFGHVFAWLMVPVAGLLLRPGRRYRIDSRSLGAVRWCALSILLYYSGYWMINNEARYIAPVVSPLLCITGLVLIGEFIYGRQRSAVREAAEANMCEPLPEDPGQRWTLNRFSMLFLAVLALVASSQDFYRIYRIVGPHAQSSKLDPYMRIARRLTESGLLPAPFAASQWHQGMFIAYAGGCSRSYIGAPLAAGETEQAAELARTSAVLYLRLVNSPDPGRRSIDKSHVLPGWKFAMVIDGASAGEVGVEVYTRQASLQ